MNITARELCDNVRTSMTNLAKDPRYGSITAVYRAVSQFSGLSESLVAKFYQGAKKNPTAQTLDSLMFGVKAAERRPAA